MSTLASADWVTLTDGSRVRGIDYKRKGKGYLFTIENGKTVYIKARNVASFEKSPAGELVAFRGQQVSLRHKIRVLKREHKIRQRKLLRAIERWAGGRKGFQEARAAVLACNDQERELLFGQTLAKSNSSSARKLAAEKIVAFNTAHAKNSLAITAVTDRSKAVRSTALNALKTVKDESIGDLFIPFVLSRDKHFRARASQALQTFPTLRAVPALITAVNKVWTGGQRSYFFAGTQRAYISDYELVSGGTTYTLTEVADPVVKFSETGVVLDVKIAKSEQELHQITLERITGQNFGGDMGKWRDWWKNVGEALALQAAKKAKAAAPPVEGG
jgi:hypothetical protein